MRIDDLKCIEWKGGAEGRLELLDQRILPTTESWVKCTTVDEAAHAIVDMTVRGAPAIGIAAAYAMVLAAQKTKGDLKAMAQAKDQLAATRPTAVNLFWALEKSWQQAQKDPNPSAMLELAQRLHRKDIEGNRRMGEAGAAHVLDGMGVLTHCNAGALATGGVGTALGVIFMAVEQKKKIHVYVDETRPRLQGARLTTWELSKMGVPYTLICDNMAASLMAKGKIQMCVTGADRIAANGDTANKIGTYSVAVNAKHHGIPFFIAAPKSTFDLSIAGGAQIPIEERNSSEITQWADEQTCAKGTKVYNPGFDVTPASLIKAIFTDCGEISPVTRENVEKVLAK